MHLIDCAEGAHSVCLNSFTRDLVQGTIDVSPPCGKVRTLTGFAIMRRDEFYDCFFNSSHQNRTNIDLLWLKRSEHVPRPRANYRIPLTTMVTEVNGDSLSSLSDRYRSRPRVLYAVTGSVAAVKGPEIAVRLANEFDLDVRILLTRGGENFWNKARDYDPKHWDLLQALLSPGDEASSKNPRISICRE